MTPKTCNETTQIGAKEACNLITTVSLPCLVMLQRVSRSYKGHQISEKFDTNEEVK